MSIDVLVTKGIYAVNVAFNLMTGTAAPEGVPLRAPAEIALGSWRLHTDREQAEHFIGA
ncbi:hypothetical protein ACWD04_14740 [Streptomyces sp. NPDC002911]